MTSVRRDPRRHDRHADRAGAQRFPKIPGAIRVVVGKAGFRSAGLEKVDQRMCRCIPEGDSFAGAEKNAAVAKERIAPVRVCVLKSRVRLSCGQAANAAQRADPGRYSPCATAT